MFIVRRRDFKKDGTARALLYGYGGLGTTETPVFVASIYSWLERGGIYAAPNLRGGNEYGEEWHQAGMHLPLLCVCQRASVNRAESRSLVRSSW